MPPREPGHVWRKKRGGREYGSYYAYAGRRIVNLGTTAVDAAREKARQLLGAPASPPPGPRPAGGTGPPAAGAPTSRAPAGPSFLHAWASSPGGGGAPPLPGGAGPGTPPPPSPPPALSSALEGLAEGFADSLAKFSALATSLSVKHLGQVQPPRVDPDELEALAKTWAVGLKEAMLISGIKWWWIAIAQHGALAMRLYQNGTPIPPKIMAPVQPTAAAAQ